VRFNAWLLALETAAAEVHKCLNLLSKTRREEGRAVRSENRASSSANRVAQAVSSSNGNGHEPCVMPQALSKRVNRMIAADSEVAAAQPTEARSEKGPKEAVTAESLSGCGDHATALISVGEVAAVLEVGDRR
jgi:hypothetical protein